MPEPKQPIPLADQGRSDQELDPAYWEKQLAKGDGDTRIYSHDQEVDLFFGAEGGEEANYAWEDEIDARIARQLAVEGDRNIFVGSPSSYEQLLDTVQTLVGELQQTADNSQIVVAVHPSCINGNDCVTVAERGAKRYHINTRRAEGYDIERLRNAVENGLEIEFIQKDN